MEYHTDGSSTRQAGRVGVVLHSPKGDEVKCMIRLNFPTTNNEAEYEVLIARLDLAKAEEATGCGSVLRLSGSHQPGEWRL